MTIEQRLTDALHEADRFDPSPDLFARVSRSIDEDRAHRRRLLRIALSMAAGVLLSIAYLTAVVSPGLTIAAWELQLFRVAISGVAVIVLAPNITRFGKSFIADVFHLSPQTAPRFLAVLNIAYYLIFTGLILGGLGFGPPTAELHLAGALEDTAFSLGFLFLTMGLLHTINIAALPFLGLIFNSVTRLALRASAGADALPESPAAARADSNARAWAIVLAVLVAGLFLPIFFGLVIGGFGG